MAGIKKLDPKQIDFLKFYLDPKSKTYGNSKQSALRAGFATQYAEEITKRNWVSEGIGKRKQMLVKAERNLDEALDVEINEQAIGAFGPMVDKETNEPIMRRNVRVMELKQDASKFVAERIGKEHYGKAGDTYDQRSLVINITSEKAERIRKRRLVGNSQGESNQLHGVSKPGV